jgi:hypothetical protein
MSKKFNSMSHRWIQPWPKNNWVDYWHIDDSLSKQINHETTKLVLTAQDILEADVADSNNADAIRMLESIGIGCERS